MDTENFIVTRKGILQQLEERRMKDLSVYPFRMGEEYGVKLPHWARFILSFVTSGSILSRFLEVGLPLALPFLVKRQIPSWGRLALRFFSPKY